MEKSIFIDFVKNLCIFFERKPVTSDAMNLWFADLAYIPDESLPWISQRIKTLEVFPKNFPGVVKVQWSNWLDANPNKRVKDKKLGCPNCHEGYIEVSEWLDDLKGFYNINFKCAYCRPRTPQDMTQATIPWLKEQGYYQPIGYLTAHKYADSMPIPAKPVIMAAPVKREPIKKIVTDITKKFTNDELPF